MSRKVEVKIVPVLENDTLWEDTIMYAEHCSWRAGKNLANDMKSNRFRNWERVFVALDGSRIVGYCTFAESDCIPNVPYSPYIGYMFVDEFYRGNRISQKLIQFALRYAKALGFKKVYLVSDHVNFYEKYGFIKIDAQPAPWNEETMETIFMYELE